MSDGKVPGAFNGLGTHLGNLSWVSKAQTRSISAENKDGSKGGGGKATEGVGKLASRELGQGWKVSQAIDIPAGETVTVADVDGPGAFTHMWITTLPAHWRRVILRMYWDDEETPSVEVPLGDFFANGWCEFSQINSIPISVNPGGGLNCYWEMPFRKHARITAENIGADVLEGFFYQFDYALTDVPDEAAYFHAQWRRANPLPYQEVHTILDGVQGIGQYVGTYIAWGVNNAGWWGEGELKFFIDGDEEWPTICTTGTEDYFGGAWAFEYPAGQYGAFSTPYLGMPQIIKPDGFFRSQQRFGLYRWHIPDPIRFQDDLRVTVQALGWRSGVRYLPLRDDIASTAFWYQLEPHQPYPDIGTANDLEVI